MLCCLLTATAASLSPLLANGVRIARGRLLHSAVVMAALSASVVAVFTAQHLGHYAERAYANERTLLAEIIAAPLCTGKAASLRHQ